MKVTDKMVDAARKVMDKTYADQDVKARDVIEAAIQAAPEVEQEPVGYVLTRRLEEMDDVDINCVLMKNKPKGAVITALYTHPQPNSEPLKKEDIMHLLEKRDEGSIIDFIRLIEKAHGIGGE